MNTVKTMLLVAGIMTVGGMQASDFFQKNPIIKYVSDKVSGGIETVTKVGGNLETLGQCALSAGIIYGIGTVGWAITKSVVSAGYETVKQGSIQGIASGSWGLLGSSKFWIGIAAVYAAFTWHGSSEAEQPRLFNQ